MGFYNALSADLAASLAFISLQSRSGLSDAHLFCKPARYGRLESGSTASSYEHHQPSSASLQEIFKRACSGLLPYILDLKANQNSPTNSLVLSDFPVPVDLACVLHRISRFVYAGLLRWYDIPAISATLDCLIERYHYAYLIIPPNYS